jgi:hypothetical protein
MSEIIRFRLGETPIGSCIHNLLHFATRSGCGLNDPAGIRSETGSGQEAVRRTVCRNSPCVELAQDSTDVGPALLTEPSPILW